MEVSVIHWLYDFDCVPVSPVDLVTQTFIGLSLDPSEDRSQFSDCFQLIRQKSGLILVQSEDLGTQVCQIQMIGLSLCVFNFPIGLELYGFFRLLSDRFEDFERQVWTFSISLIVRIYFLLTIMKIIWMLLYSLLFGSACTQIQKFRSFKVILAWLWLEEFASAVREACLFRYMWGLI